MSKLERLVHQAARSISMFSGIVVMMMMLLTCADVILRFFGHPIPGTYELVGFFGALVISFAMAYTSVERSHIAVEIFFERLPRRVQVFLEGAVTSVSLALFVIITRQCQIYAQDMKHSGEVSLTLGIPVYPVVAGIAVGCAFLCLALLFDIAKSIGRLFK
ncbi:MAG: TRAP transporter small permease [Syntrophales bacterium]|nr:TRAP transporter small permease [Syntrophales bacterium]